MFTLHELDILRKHRRLIAVRIAPTKLVVFGRNMSFPDPLPHFTDNAVIGWTGINEQDPQFHMSIDISFDEGYADSGTTRHSDHY